MAETLFPSPDHDHKGCIDTAVARAKSVCQQNGVKFTSLREQVFRVITSSHKAIGAYEIIDVLSEEGRKVAPISMYRILDALREIGLIHRLESRNAYFACHSKHQEEVNSCRSQVYLICKDCDIVVEVEAGEIGDAVQKTADAARFKLQEALLEIVGVCQHCSVQT